MIERTGTDLSATVAREEVLRTNQDRITIVKMKVENTISSTVVRQCLAAGHSAKYLADDGVLDYIQQQKLHQLPQWQ